MKRTLISLLALTFLVTVPVHALACTTFCFKGNGEILFGKSYDWMIGDGLVFVNKRGVSKVSSETDNPARWVSKFGSVTFNQYGWESPSGGMNEAGLVIELMWLDDTQYPQPDERPTVDVLEWIQFNLDTAATTEEVIKNNDAVRISSAVKLHYLVNDRSGNSATIEFLDGKLVAHTGDHLPVPTLTNDTYERSLDYARKTSMTPSESSLDRFSRAAQATKGFASKSSSEKLAVDQAFDVLANVAQKNSTQWSIVYDQKRGRVYFRTRKRPALKSIDATALDYACGTPVRILDVNTNDAGDITARFKPYSRKDNRDLIGRAFDGTDFLKKVPSSTRDQIADFPEQFRCSVNGPVTRPVDPKSLVASGGYAFLCFPLYYVYALVSS